MGYQFRRGDYAGVVRAGEQLMHAHPRFSYLGWAISYGQIALSHLELGNVERALSISEHACSLLDDELRQYAVTHFTLESAYAAALIASGNRERGHALFEAMIARLRSSGDDSPAILMHEYRAKVAGLIGDGEAESAALKDMRDTALASGNASAILRADSVARLRARARHSPLPPVESHHDVPDTFRSTQGDETVVTELLQGQQVWALQPSASWCPTSRSPRS